jgi:trehalose 6-phosphate phosphatase
LSQVVTDPYAARPLPGVEAALNRLVDAGATVAVVSGRPLEYLQGCFDGRFVLSGLYGLEFQRDGVVSVHAGAEPWQQVVADAVARARRELPGGVLVEPKGLALTLHYRESPDDRQVAEAWAEAEAARSGLVLATARMSVELNPPIEVDKGTVVAELALGSGAVRACYLGDDRADLAAFRALRDLAIDTVSVAVRGAETPPEVIAAADLVVAGPEEVLGLLQALVES